jgi:hypothetical protein
MVIERLNTEIRHRTGVVGISPASIDPRAAEEVIDP